MMSFAGCLAILALGVVSWGWWLAALAVPKSAVLIAGLLLAYGLGVGWGSLVPASAVISMAIALVVAFDRIPAFWPDQLLYKYWAYTVLLLWAVSMVVVVVLAWVGKTLHQTKSAYRLSLRLTLLGSLLLMLWTGGTLYRAAWPSWVPWENL